jgi:hypothetical protein
MDLEEHERRCNVIICVMIYLSSDQQEAFYEILVCTKLAWIKSITVRSDFSDGAMYMNVTVDINERITNDWRVTRVIGVYR